MFVKNFSILLVADSYVPPVHGGSPMFKIKGADGNEYIIGFNSYNNQVEAYNSKIFTINNVIFGNSDAATANDDYNIHGDAIIIDSLAIKTAYGLDRDSKINLYYTVTGIPANDAVVKELGLFKNIYYSNSLATSSMLYREVLAEPLIFKAGEQFELGFKISFAIN